MIERVENWNEATSALDAVEQEMAKTVAAQKAEIEKALTEQINREKSEAQKKIEATEREFAGVRQVLEEQRTVMSELNTARQRLQTQVKQRFSHALSLRKTLAQISAEAAEEWETLEKLKRELDGIRERAAEKAEFLSGYLESQFGIKNQFATAFEIDALPPDYQQAMLTLQRVRDMLASIKDLSPEEAEDAQAPVEVKEPLAAATGLNLSEADFSEVPIGLGELIAGAEPIETAKAGGNGKNGGNGDAMLQQVAEAAAPETEEAAVSAAETPAEPEPEPEASERLNVLLETLTHYRRTESVANGSEIAFFQKDREKVLDGESFMETMTKIIDSAKMLHRQLEGTESLKDLFMIKQEILNEQEILRKVFFRIVKFCDKEGGSLPDYIAEILTSQSLKDVLERLTMGNWSNDGDFRTFVEEMATLKNAIMARTVASTAYAKSLLDQLEGNHAAL